MVPMAMIDLTSRPKTVTVRTGANVLAASLLLCISILLNAASLQAQGGGGTVPTPSDDSTSVPLDPMLITLGPEEWRIGVYFGINLNRYSADNITGMAGVPSCCPGYDGGNGFGLAFGGLIQYPVNDLLSIGGRIYLQTYNGALIDEETETVDGGGFAETAVLEHRIDADIWSVALEPIVGVNVTDELKIFGGLRGDVIVKKHFSQRERILSPGDISFENDRTERMVFEGQIPRQTSMQGSILGGASYDFEFGDEGQFVLSPEVSFWYGLSPVVEDESWKIHGARFAVSAQFLRFADPEEEELGILSREIERRKAEIARLKAAEETRLVELPVSDEMKGRTSPGTGSGG